jgi:beta-N-acetylhexosaminidase
LTDSVRGDWGRTFAAALKDRRPNVQVFYADQDLASPLSTPIVQAAANAQKVVIAAFVTPVAAKQVEVNGNLVNSVGLEPQVAELLRQVLSRAAAKAVLVAMGNPYIAKDFPEVQTYLCTFSNASSSELAAVKVLFGEMPARGRLPVTLPGIAARGFSFVAESSGKNTQNRPAAGVIHNPAQ